MNDQITYKTASQLLSNDWMLMSEVPKGLLFKCIVMFEKKFHSGNPYIGTGWMHTDGTFEADAELHSMLVPERFIPLYEQA